MTARRFAACGVLMLSAAVSAAQGPGWWNYAWTYRRRVTVENAAATRLPGEDVAVLEMPTAGLTAADGHDLRVVTAAGRPRPVRVLMMGPGDRVRLAFAVQAGVKAYWVYLHNAKAPPLPEAQQLDLRRGVLLEMWEYPGGPLHALKQVRAIFARKDKTFIGRGFRDRVFLGHNPFGPQNKLASVFTGWLRCPKDGTYTFASSSRDASFLLVDETLVVDNGGRHRPQRDIRKNGEIDLKAGLHKLTFYHVTRGGDPVAVAAWKPPGSGRVRPIPPKAFAPVARAQPGGLEKYAQQLTIDFLPRHADEVFLKNRYYQRYEVKALAAGRTGRGITWRWDFGDGQTAEGEAAAHIYLLPGEYTVTLSAQTWAGPMQRTNRIFVSRPWDRVTQTRLGSLHEAGAIVAKYDFTKLPTEALGEAMLLLDRARQAKALVAAGRELTGRDEAPRDLLDEALPVLADELVAQGVADQAVAALVRGAEMTKGPAVCARLLVRAGRIALDVRGDVQTAGALFERVVDRYGALTTAAAVRQARIGIGDVWRARGDAEKARKAYDAAKTGPLRGKSIPITRGDYARQVEAHLRDGKHAWAEQALQAWRDTLPADKLEGYWSLLRVRLFLAQKRYAAAAREAHTLVKVNPRSTYAPPLLMRAAEAHRELHEDEKATAALRQVAEGYPESPLAAEARKALAGE